MASNGPTTLLTSVISFLLLPTAAAHGGHLHIETSPEMNQLFVVAWVVLVLAAVVLAIWLRRRQAHNMQADDQ